MSNRPLKTYSQGAARVDIPIDAIMAAVGAYVDEITDAVAAEVLQEAKNTAQFTDQSGNLRRSGAVRKSRYNKGEVIVGFSAPHAHLIEHGHLMVKRDGTETAVKAHGEVMSHVPAYPFLGPAQDTVMDRLPEIIGRIVPPDVKVGG